MYLKNNQQHIKIVQLFDTSKPGVIVTPHNLSIHLYDKNPKLSRSSENRKEKQNAKSSSIQT